jgi:hypothetical protein
MEKARTGKKYPPRIALNDHVVDLRFSTAPDARAVNETAHQAIENVHRTGVADEDASRTTRIGEHDEVSQIYRVPRRDMDADPYTECRDCRVNAWRATQGDRFRNAELTEATAVDGDDLSPGISVGNSERNERQGATVVQVFMSLPLTETAERSF